MPLRMLLRAGFVGKIFPINPNVREIEGIDCVDAVPDLPLGLDVLVAVVPADRLITEIEGLRPGSVRVVLAITSGFGESGIEGQLRQERLWRACKAIGARLVGPNSVGVANLWANSAMTISQAFSKASVPGGIAIFSQSGAIGSAIVAECRALGLDIGYFLSTGNEADVTLEELLEELAESARWRVAVCYIEQVRDGRRFLRALSRCLELGKPIVVLKVGRTELGAASAQSHTGALAGSYTVFEALVARSGAIMADSVEEAIDVLGLLSCVEPRRRSTLGAVTHSGGLATMIADAATANGFGMPHFPDSTVSELVRHLPQEANVAPTNPLDVGAAGAFAPDILIRSVAIAMESADFHVVVVGLILMPSTGKYVVEQLQALRREHDTPIVVIWLGGDAAYVHSLMTAGIPSYSDPTRCMKAMRLVEQWCAAAEDYDGPRDNAGDRASSERIFRDKPEILTIRRSATFPEIVLAMEPLGIRVPDWVVVRDEGNCERELFFPFPVVAKVLAPASVHKAAKGGVIVGIDNAAGLRRAVKRLLSLSLSNGWEPAVLVQRQVLNGLEFIVGCKRDTAFGPIVMIGSGGVKVEEQRDVDFFAAPLTEEQAERAVQEWSWKQSLGTPGSPSRDMKAFGRLVASVSEAFCRSNLDQLDLNPVMILGDGDGVYAVDIRPIPRSGCVR